MCGLKGEVTIWPSPWVILSDEHFRAQYVILKTLGQGGFAKVKLAHHRLTGIPVAIKVLRKRKKRYPVRSEVEILKMLDHPNIISLIQVIETEDKIYLVQELAEGRNLWHWIDHVGYLQENTCRNIFQQVLQAMQYCHDRGIIHRDLKPENIIVDRKGRVKIIDFGLAALFTPGSKLFRFCGTLQYVPPEFFLRKAYDGLKMDSWSLGIVLYYMATGTLPFDGDSVEVGSAVVLGKYNIPAHLSPELQDIIRQLLTVNPKERPSVKDILRHPWLQHDEEGPKSQTNEAPRFVNIDILEAMRLRGFDPGEVLKSLVHKLYNEPMAIYRLLQCQAHQKDDSTSPTNAVHPVVTPFPSLADPANVHPCPKRGLDVLTSQIVFSSLNTETSHTSEIVLSSSNTETSQTSEIISSSSNTETSHTSEIVSSSSNTETPHASEIVLLSSNTETPRASEIVLSSSNSETPHTSETILSSSNTETSHTSEIILSSSNTETSHTSEIVLSSSNTETPEDGQQEERLRRATPEDGQQEERLRRATPEDGQQEERLRRATPEDGQQEERLRSTNEPVIPAPLQKTVPNLDRAQVLTWVQDDRTTEEGCSPCGVWRRWSRRIREGLLHLCCCLPGRQKSKGSNKVVPQDPVLPFSRDPSPAFN